MILTNLIVAAILVLMAGAMVYGAAKVFQTYLNYRGRRVITCPETHAPAAVHVNAAKAARVAMTGKQYIRLDQCSRWPERQNCGQECLSQVHADPESCLEWRSGIEGKLARIAKSRSRRFRGMTAVPCCSRPRTWRNNGLKFRRRNCRKCSRHI